MKRVTVSSSIKFKEQIREAIEQMAEHGVTGSFPNLDSGVEKEDVDLEFMRKLAEDHFKSVHESEGLYVICPKGYVGTFVSVEIGYAKAQGKIIIFSEEPKDLGLQALADFYIPMNELNKLKDL